jgi:hypothetical protein
MTTLAIDIGGTKLAAALIDSRLTLLERREVPTPASQTPAALAAALAALVAPLGARGSFCYRLHRHHSGRHSDRHQSSESGRTGTFSPAGVFIRPHGVARYCPQ